MANKKITDLTNLQTPVANSEFVVVDLQDDETKSITFANLEIATTAGVEARRAANVVLREAEDTALQARITANSTAFQAEDTALQARLTTNVTAFTNEDTALQARITANNTLITELEARRAANLVSATFTGQVNMSDDLIVTGNLTVNGDTTTISTTNLDVEDRIIMLANGASGSPSNDVGILFNRGNQGNAAIFYDESAKTFKFSDTKDPTSNTSLSPVTASNISVGILDAATVKFDGADLNTAITDNVSTLNTTDTALQARITANNTLITGLETRRTQNIAGAVSTITTGDLTVDRALISSGAAKVAVSAITATELGHLDGIDQNINSNLTALAAGIAGTVISADAPTGDYGLLDTANTSTDSFGVAVGSLTTFDMKTEPAGTLNTQDLGALT